MYKKIPKNAPILYILKNIPKTSLFALLGVDISKNREILWPDSNSATQNLCESTSLIKFTRITLGCTADAVSVIHILHANVVMKCNS